MFFFSNLIQLTAKIAVVKLEGAPYLCKSDEVGELCISSGATGSAYWGLAGKTNHTFKVIYCNMMLSLINYLLFWPEKARLRFFKASIP